MIGPQLWGIVTYGKRNQQYGKRQCIASTETEKEGTLGMVGAAWVCQEGTQIIQEHNSHLDMYMTHDAYYAE